ncbi:MAG: nucleotidyltransferase [Gracilimonas sp.]|uniref:nucleotidyltransferase n=1 Tax=Gracilimonas sp. TaxID=1974203 RepID=UPI0019B17A7C|nr:nucleotidyltransferase [Gracilimonas sp.]MBD3614971.1 nucleotidyltransferase [Gracilimonas sp.]
MDSNYFSGDIKEFIRLLDRYDVKYMIVGGEAVIYYGYPRLTGDVDFFFSSEDKNVTKLFKALSEFWDGDIPGIETVDELKTPGYVIQFGLPPNRIDLMNSIDEVDFGDAWKKSKTEQIEVNGKEVPVYYLGLEHLIKNKAASARDKDLDDLSYLRKL